MPSSFHEPGHRILVSFAKGDADDLLYLRYQCEDRTCDWCVVEFGPDECQDLVRISDELLTHEFYSENLKGGPHGHHQQSRSDQPSLFSANQGEDQ